MRMKDGRLRRKEKLVEHPFKDTPPRDEYSKDWSEGEGAMGNARPLADPRVSTQPGIEHALENNYGRSCYGGDDSVYMHHSRSDGKRK